MRSGREDAGTGEGGQQELPMTILSSSVLRQQLLAEAIRNAVTMLEQRGWFHPFGIIHADAGDLVRVDVPEPEGGFPRGRPLEALLMHLRRHARSADCAGVAITRDLYLPQRGTHGAMRSIRIDIEDRWRPPTTCHLPYKLEGRQVEPGPLVTEPGSNILLPPPTDPHDLP